MLRTRGTLVRWVEDKGFGFIRPDDGGQDVFVHARDFGAVSRRPQVGDVIWFQPANDGSGRFRAADVTIEGVSRAVAAKRTRRDDRRPPRMSRAGHAVIVGAVAFTAVVLGLTVLDRLPPVVPFTYLMVSACTFIVYAFDKSAAMGSRWRTSERALHLLGVLGGWPGAVVAQQMFRHKSSKVAFQVEFWVTVVANCGALIWLMTAEGRAFLAALTG